MSAAHYGWPPYMLTRLACDYLGCKRWYLARAARDGRLPIAGRNGRSLVFAREDLDRLLLGDGAPTVQPIAKAPKAHARAKAPKVNALDRIAALRRGGTP